LDDQFIEFIGNIGDDGVDWETFCRQTLCWESATFAFKHSPSLPQQKIAIWFRFQSQTDAASFLNALEAFLLKWIPSHPKWLIVVARP
jgi:hypothetical protein